VFGGFGKLGVEFRYERDARLSPAGKEAGLTIYWSLTPDTRHLKQKMHRQLDN
jgi:hypothetical protein